MKRRFILFMLLAFFVSLIAIESPLSAKNEMETIICPGRGERCMRVKIKILGLCFWKRKEVGGPSIIVEVPK